VSIIADANKHPSSLLQRQKFIIMSVIKKGVLGALTSGQTGFSKTRKTLDFSSRVTSKNCDATCVLFALA
jgi:hypothetical protein